MSSDTGNLNWLLDDFTNRVPHIVHSLAVSVDGLMIASSQSLDRDHADRLAAVASGLVSLLKGAADTFGVGAVSYNMTDYTGGYMFSMAAGSGASLLVLADKNCDIGVVAYEMAELINKVGDALVPGARAGTAAAASGRLP